MITVMGTDKFSATVDAALLAQVRAYAGPRGLSAFVAEALRHELDRVQLRMITEAVQELIALVHRARTADLPEQQRAPAT